MAQKVLFSCSCGWQGSALIGPTMTQPALPLPSLCSGCKKICQGNCTNCEEPLENWDQQSCPLCAKEIRSQTIAMVD